MAPPHVAVAAIVGVAVISVVGFAYSLFSQKEENIQYEEFSSNNQRNKYNDEPESDSDSDDESIRLRNLYKNHDHQKVKHPSEARANAVILRMRNSGKDKNHKLRSYYNTELNGWFVGNSKYD